MKLIRRAPALILCAVFAACLGQGRAEAGVDLPFASTLSCPAWTQDGSSIVCEGISNDHINSYCQDATGNVPAMIRPDGSDPSGGTGNVFRVPVGDGVNNGGGTPTVYLNTPQPEVWIRFNLRYPAAFRWSELAYHKLIYVNQTAGNNTAIVDMYGSGNDGSVSLYIQSWGATWHLPDHSHEADTSLAVPNWGWDQIMGGPTGDGKWHSYEAHFKINSAPGVPDGIYQQWVDGRLVNNHRDVEWNASPFTSFSFGTNQKEPGNGGCVYVDWGNFAVRNDRATGPIAGR